MLTDTQTVVAFTKVENFKDFADCDFVTQVYERVIWSMGGWHIWRMGGGSSRVGGILEQSHRSCVQSCGVESCTLRKLLKNTFETHPLRKNLYEIHLLGKITFEIHLLGKIHLKSIF